MSNALQGIFVSPCLFSFCTFLVRTLFLWSSVTKHIFVTFTYKSLAGFSVSGWYIQFTVFSLACSRDTLNSQFKAKLLTAFPVRPPPIVCYWTACSSIQFFRPEPWQSSLALSLLLHSQYITKCCWFYFINWNLSIPHFHLYRVQVTTLYHADILL